MEQKLHLLQITGLSETSINDGRHVPLLRLMLSHANLTIWKMLPAMNDLTSQAETRHGDSVTHHQQTYMRIFKFHEN